MASRTLSMKGEKIAMAKNIIVIKRGSRYIARLKRGELETQPVGVGRSVSEAVGDLVCSHRSEFDVELEATEETSKPRS